VTGPFTWSTPDHYSTLSGPAGSFLEAAGGMTLTGYNYGLYLSGRTLVNASAASWLTTGPITVTGGAEVDNRAGATFGSPGNISTLYLNGGTHAGSGTVNA
jgi:hypothetical protein